MWCRADCAEEGWSYDRRKGDWWHGGFLVDAQAHQRLRESFEYEAAGYGDIEKLTMYE